MVVKTGALSLAEATSDTRVRTLVVDDSPFLLKILAQILQESGNFDLVGTATDGCQALRYVSMLSPELILMDVHMPRLNGIQATRYIKQREHPPAIIIVTSDDSAVARATAEEAGADAFVSKEGNLRQQMMGALPKLFGPSAAAQAKASRISSQDPLQDTQKCGTAQEKPRVNHVASGPPSSPLAINAIRATRPAKVSGRTNNFGKRTARQDARCSGPIENTGSYSAPNLIHRYHPQVPQLCASPRIQPARNAGSETYNIMKRRIRHINSSKQIAPPTTTPVLPLTHEEIRQRAHGIFMARGGTPGNELDDWLRAEQELKQERAGTNTNAT